MNRTQTETKRSEVEIALIDIILTLHLLLWSSPPRPCVLCFSVRKLKLLPSPLPEPRSFFSLGQLLKELGLLQLSGMSPLGLPMCQDAKESFMGITNKFKPLISIVFYLNIQELYGNLSKMYSRMSAMIKQIVTKEKKHYH